MSELTKKQKQRQHLEAFAHELKANGYTVLVSAVHPFEWLHFEKGGYFGTVGPDYFYGYNFGTVHKPCREAGTGYGLGRQVDLSFAEAEKCLTHSTWPEHRPAVKFYKSVEDFLAATNNKWAEYYIL
jgi:hypothetical protein